MAKGTMTLRQAEQILKRPGKYGPQAVGVARAIVKKAEQQKSRAMPMGSKKTPRRYPRG